jgi:16S rRNA (adenine1518-N6/adenine1519-N6)-dimethyltransferase
LDESAGDESARTSAIDALPPLREVIARFALGARKSLGQHFLLDLNLTRRIARSAGDLSQGTVIEVGPGPGGLTRALLAEGAARLIAIERDRRCIEALGDLVAASHGRLTLLEEDATAVDAAALGTPPRQIVANLPYNISTVLLIRWLRQAEAFAGMTLMFQKEVADRIVAKPGSKSYGRLSVMANWRCDVEVLFNLPARAFTPPPKVASSVVQFLPLPEPRHPAPWGAMETVVAAAFGQRRKMLRGALRTLKVDSNRLLAETGIDPEARAETLSVEAFAALARSYATLS